MLIDTENTGGIRGERRRGRGNLLRKRVYGLIGSVVSDWGDANY